MKKVMIVAAAALLFGLAGCSEEKLHDCKCTIVTTYNGQEMTRSYEYYYDQKEEQVCGLRNTHKVYGLEREMAEDKTCEEML